MYLGPQGQNRTPIPCLYPSCSLPATGHTQPARRAAAERRPRRRRHRDRPGRPAHARARRDRRERRAPPHRRRPRASARRRCRGCSTPTRSPSAACCSSAAGSATCSAGSRSSRPAWPSSRWARPSAASPRRRASSSPPAPSRASAPPSPRPSVLALLTTSAPDEAARNRALALFGAVSSGGASIGLLLGGLLTDVGSWRWTLFINVPIGIAVLFLAPALRRRDAAPSRTLRLRRRGQRHPRRRLARLGPDRHPRARLDLGAHHRRLRRRRRAARGPAGPHRAPAPAPDDPAATGAQPPPGRRARGDGAGDRREPVDVLPGRPVRPGGARLRAAGRRRRVPAVQPGHLRDVAGDPAAARPVRRRAR